jgi:cell division protein FtsI (penicillin-binding protein 3)
MQPPAPDWRVTLKRRLLVAVSLLSLWALAIEVRLGYLQMVMRPELQARAESQHNRTPRAPAKRGDIVDRRGNILATSVDADSVYAVPSALKDKELAVKLLCDALGDCAARERQKLLERFHNQNQRAFAYVRRQISAEAAGRVAALGLDGVGFIKESRRAYPNTQLAAHTLGYVGIDNKGLNGIESAYDSQIRGKDGTVLVTSDARGHVFSRVERPPTAGSSIELTVDRYLQFVAERELHAGVAENRAAGGTAVILDPSTGEILAMANEPTFDPNAFGVSPEAARRNRAVQDLYEPGSTFKIVTASAAIDEHVMSTTAYVDTTPGIIRIGNRVIDEFRGHNYGVLTFSDVLIRSSNVGAVKIGFRLGAERLGKYVERFGFGRPLSPDFPGESPGIVWSPDKWTEDAIASVSMGYQVGVTALQMVAAAGAIANGGELIEPRIVRAVYRDNRRYAVKPKVIRRVVEPSTAATLTTIMESVVTDGTAKLAKIDGYTVAGKTGTASKLINGRYSATENNVSFVGFAPSRKPALAIIVMIDAPHANGNSGGGVAAPIFSRIATSAMRYLGVAPTINPAPPVLVPRGQPSRVAVPPAIVEQQPVVTLVSDDGSHTMPDLRGLSARDAVRTLNKLGVSARMSGQGVVLAQDPLPGTPFESGDIWRLQLGRRPAHLKAGGTQP